jgi:hypothetical protein
MQGAILQSYLNNFAAQNDFQGFDEPKLFSYFVANCALSPLTAETLATASFPINSGGSNST